MAKDIMNPELTALQARFVQEYLIDVPPNGRQAAIRCGCKPEIAHSMASRWLKDPKIRLALQEAQKERAERTNITKDRVLKELEKIGFAPLAGEEKDVLIEKEITDFKTGEVTSTTIKARTVKPADKINALINISKMQGYHKELVEHSGTITLEQLVQDSFASNENEETEIIEATD